MKRWGSSSRKAVVYGCAAALLLGACDDPGAEKAEASPPPSPVATAVPITAPPTTATPATITPATITTTAPVPVTAPPVAPTVAVPAPPAEVTVVPPEGLLPGMRGPAVLQLQQRLVDLRYDPGALDGKYGGGVAVALTAFQKVVELPRTGRANPETLAAMANAVEPAPMLPDGGPTRVEIDFKRQVLFFWKDGALLRILPVSTGNGRKYCETDENGQRRCGVAVTPSGSYRIERRIKGKRKSYLGILYNPLYFRGGFAIHGSPSVPARPASHGCVRIPIFSSVWFYDNVPNRTPVYLIGGKYPAKPFPPDPPPADPNAPPADPNAPPADPNAPPPDPNAAPPAPAEQPPAEQPATAPEPAPVDPNAPPPDDPNSPPPNPAVAPAG